MPGAYVRTLQKDPEPSNEGEQPQHTMVKANKTCDHITTVCAICLNDWCADYEVWITRHAEQVLTEQGFDFRKLQESPTVHIYSQRSKHPTTNRAQQ